MKPKLSKRDTSLLIILLGVIILVIVYMYVFKTYNEKTETLNSQNVILSQQNSLLSQITANATMYKENTEEYKQSSDEIALRYPSLLQEEDVILYFAEIEGNMSNVYTSYVGTPEETALIIEVPTREDLLESAQDITGVIAANDYINDGTYLDVSQVTVYRIASSQSLYCSYDSMKAFIDKIANENNPRAIDSIAIAYDESYGLCNVATTTSIYYLGGIEDSYEEPRTGVNSHYVDNIFGTVEMLDNANQDTESNE